MAEMKTLILDYREPSSGSWMKEENWKQQSLKFQNERVHFFYDRNTQKQTHIFNSFLWKHLRLLETMWKLKQKIKICVQCLTITFHKYSIYINTDMNTQYKSGALQKTFLSSSTNLSQTFIYFYCKLQPKCDGFTV